MKTPEHMKRWLIETDRRFIVLNSVDLIDALPWPEGAQALAQFIDAYRDQRRVQTNGRTVRHPHPDKPGEHINVPLYKTEFLEIEEVDRAIRDLIGVATKLDPTWSLENAPL